MNTKDNIRYIGFQTTGDGGRRFEFAVKAADQEFSVVSVDIPGLLFVGSNRIMVQEGAGICFEKLRDLYERAGTDHLPIQVLLTGNDVSLYRHIVTPKGRQPQGVMDRRNKAGEPG